MQPIQAPTHCPSCDSELESVNFVLYCRNPKCGSQTQKKIEHFVKTLKIKGLGPKSIEKLGITSIPELYSLDVDGMTKALASNQIAKKVFSEIENSKNASANTLIPAFSIPLVGKVAAQKLASVVACVDDITYTECMNAGLGPKAANNLMQWVSGEYMELRDALPFSWEFTANKANPKEKKGVVCISGKLSSFKTKAEAASKLEELGYTIKSSLTKDVTILVNESGIESSKTQKARDSGVTIISNIFELIGE